MTSTMILTLFWYLLIVYCSFVTATTNIRQVLRFVSVPESSLMMSEQNGRELHTTARNKIHCIQKCLLTNWCELSCYQEPERCILSWLIVYENNEAVGNLQLNCYTMKGKNFASGASVSGTSSLFILLQ